MQEVTFNGDITTSSTRATVSWAFICVVSILIAGALHWILSSRRAAAAEKVTMEEIRKRRLQKVPPPASAPSSSSTSTTNPSSSPPSPPSSSSSSPVHKKQQLSSSKQDSLPSSPSSSPPSANGKEGTITPSVTASSSIELSREIPQIQLEKTSMSTSTPSVAKIIQQNKPTELNSDVSRTKSLKPPPPPVSNATGVQERVVTKKTKEKKPLTVANRLCALLSNIFEASVLPKGANAVRSTKQTIAAATTTTALTLPISMDVAEKELLDQFERLLKEQPPSFWYQTKPSGLKEIRWLVQRHDRLVVNLLAQQQKQAQSSNDNEAICVCLQKLQEWIWKECYQLLSPEVGDVHDDPMDLSTDDMPDLFADEEADAGPNSASSPSNLGPNTQEWIVLFEDMNPSLTPILLEGITTRRDNSGGDAMLTFWMQEISRRLSMAYQKPSMEVTTLIPRRWNAFLHLWTQSTKLRHLYAQQYLGNETTAPETGLALEQSVPWAEMCRAAAFCLPTTKLDEAKDSLFGQMMIQSVAPQEPDQVGRLVFSRNAGRSIQNTFDSSRSLMLTARMTGQSFWKLFIKSAEDKKVVFAWFRKVIQTNDSLTEMLHADLLSNEGIVQLASSWRFLLGLSSTIVSLCADSMKQRLEKKGVQAFDGSYLEHFGMLDERHRLVSNDNQTAIKKKSKDFDGATEFFFLSAALLHVSLYPMMRVENAFHQQYNKLFIILQDQEKQKSHVPPHLQNQSTAAVVTWFGFDSFMDDPEWISKMTSFALTQLQYVRTIILQDDSRSVQQMLSCTPDWALKEPARWLAHVANKSPKSLAVYQADLAVDVTTQLLTAGSGDKSSPFRFSPLVLTELLRVESAFVQCSARRSKRKQQYRRRRGFGANHDEEDNADDENSDVDEQIYLSFDQNDLGIAVFTNRRVCEELCPTLLKTFQALDHIEGLNVDAEASFDKFSVKVEIARLLLRLWRHPNGECKQSIVKLPAEDIRSFASSVAAAIGYLLDDACQRYSDVVKLSRRHPNTLSPQDRAFQEKQTRGAVNGFLCGRTFLLLLHRLSEVDHIAQAIGGGSSAHDMASMLVHFLDILTDPDGGTHSDLDVLPPNERTSSIFYRSSRMVVGEKTKLAAEVCRTRRRTRHLIGLDVSEFAHVFIALAARWFTVSADGGNSELVSAMSSQDDCDIAKYWKVFDRLIPMKSPQPDADPAGTVFHHDGYVDSSMFPSDPNTERTTEMQRQLMRTARQCHMSHEQISSVANRKQIKAFLTAVESTKKQLGKDVELRPGDILKAVERIMNSSSFSSDSAYGDALSSWTVSSEPFSDRHSSDSFMHYFDKMARDRGASGGSGKTLVKEARKCHKGIPVPHPNSAVFVCFAEERMDLCRAIVLGPVETPYSLGAFVFDIYFPPTYPHIPPLVQFMTTGGGQVRFGPNLYQDGKVCLSLLGTFHAGDESQQWNPRISSLAQILLSIQTQLLVKDPYFLEPGHEAMMNTPAGQDASNKYNLRRKLDTLRHGILDALIQPPLGFEEVLKRHFAFCRQRILVQARRWTLEARGTQLASRFEKVYGQIVSCMNEFDPALLTEFTPLEPLKEDVAYVARADPTFCLGSIREDKKPAARTSSTVPHAAPPQSSSAANPWGADFNPWENDIGAAHAGMQGSGLGEDADEEDDDFYS